MNLVVKTPPVKRPVSATSAMEFAKIDLDSEPENVELFIASATVMVETFLSRSLMSRTYTLTLNEWPETANGSEWWDGAKTGVISSLVASGPVSLSMPPVTAVSEIRIFDEDGSHTILAAESYQLDKDPNKPKIYPLDGWPIVGRNIAGIEIDFKAGYDNPADVNPAIRSGILYTFTELYEKRGGDGDIPKMAKETLKQFRVRRL